MTNGRFSKAEMNKIAAMAGNAYARCIRPVGTMADGDTVYGASTGEVEDAGGGGDGPGDPEGGRSDTYFARIHILISEPGTSASDRRESFFRIMKEGCL